MLVLGSRTKLVSVLPASVLGYAATYAYVVQTPGALETDALLHLGRLDGVIVVSVSMVLGALLGVLSQRLARVLTKA